MNKKEYLQELSKRLSRLPREEMLEALQYYNEYFDEAGEDREEEVIKKLGPPEKVTSQIISECAIKSMNAPAKSVKQGLSTVWIVILAIFAAPIAAPVAIALAAVVFCIAIAIILVLIAVIVTAAAIAGSGIFSLGAGIIGLFHYFPSGLTIMGAGMVMIGLGILILYISIALTKYVLKWLALLFKKVIKRGKKYEEFN